MRNILKKTLATLLRPVAQATPLKNWNYWLGRIYDIKLPGKVKPFASETTGCSANINIVMQLLHDTRNLDGDIAECGVFKGATLVSFTHTLHNEGDKRSIYGFDSFEGFGVAAEAERATDATGHIDLETEMFKNTSVGLIRSKLQLTKTPSDQLLLVKGYFEHSLPAYQAHRYSFVHLDCDLASSYQTCLEFFYPRLQSGGVILFDEYLDPVYTAATETIDAFFSDKPEKPIKMVRDNYIKYYIRKA